MDTGKQLWVLTGGNGAGKSTFYRLCLQPRGMAFVNADQIARDIAPDNPEQASYEAASHAALLRQALLEEGVSFCYETVFSHPSKIDFVAEAKARGYEVILVFVHLDNSMLNKARVSQRVAEGGHNVPEDKIETRLPRTLDNVKVAMALADQVHVLDNSRSDQPLRRMARIHNGRAEVLQAGCPDWVSALLDDYL
ncbi:MAG: hypothetical protein CVV16_04075 [Gammaproteobacteria bacterium HGW-Gammaproteobacteria-6]|nr:MAG: hypothetical protein CVV16_04075 [Gammaproteobacteria bacterium HGW-Gammaproteobacteria-6]